MKSLILLNAIALALFARAVFASPNPITNFGVVSPGIYRGALPNQEHLRFLKLNGVKTILTLDGNKRDIAEEKVVAAVLGIRVISIPMSFFWRPRSREVDAALAVVNDPSLWPIFVHCHAGKDRTGLILGLHRVEREGWSAHAAYAEMLRHGFHDELFLMKDYFEWRTDTNL